MIFNVIAEMKKVLNRSLYSLLALVALTVVTFSLGGVLIYNIVEDEEVEVVEEGVKIDINEREYDSYEVVGTSPEDVESLKPSEGSIDLPISPPEVEEYVIDEDDLPKLDIELENVRGGTRVPLT